MGHEEDPPNGKTAAGTIFGAVFVYIVRPIYQHSSGHVLTMIGIPGILRISSTSTRKRKSKGRHISSVISPSRPHILESTSNVGNGVPED